MEKFIKLGDIWAIAPSILADPALKLSVLKSGSVKPMAPGPIKNPIAKNEVYY